MFTLKNKQMKKETKPCDYFRNILNIMHIISLKGELLFTEPALYPPTVKHHTGFTCYLSYKDIPFLSTNNNFYYETYKG